MTTRIAGRWTLLRRLGRGGMAEVWLARDESDGSLCALKQVRGGAEHVPRLRREFEALSALRHPSLVRVLDFVFTAAGEPFLALEYVPGVPADAGLARGDWPALVDFGARVARGLAALHGAGIAHGDLKPANLLVVPAAGSGAVADVRIVDLGLSALRGAPGAAAAGTPGYAAPERVRGGTPDAASDLYEFGATLWSLATGDPPPGHGRPGSPALEKAGMPERLRELVMSLLAENPAERPAAAADVALELESLRRTTRPPLAERLDAEALVGRAAERVRFAEALAARAPRPLVIEGEAGSGRSALLDQFAASALAGSAAPSALQGRAVLRSRADLAALPAALRRLEALAASSPTGAAAKAAGARAAEAATARGPDPGAMRGEALAWLGAIAETRGPLVLLLDDLDLADEAGRAWWTRLLLDEACPPLLAVVTLRSLAALGGPLDMLAAAGGATVLALGPLEPGALAQMLEVRLGEPAPEILLSWLARRGGGHPRLTLELLRAAVASGAVRERDGALAVVEEGLEALGAPLGLEEARFERASRLPAPARAVLTALAACGGAALEAELDPWLGPDFEAGCAAAVAARLVRREDGGGLAIVSPSFAARWLASRDESERERSLRRALKRSGIPPREVFRLLCALGESAKALDLAESIHAAGPDLEVAARCAELAGGLGDAARAGAWHARAGDAALLDGRMEEASRRFAAALERPLADEVRRHALAEQVACLIVQERLDDLEAFTARLLAEDPPPAIGAMAKIGQGSARALRRDLAGAEALFTEADELARVADDPEVLSRTRFSLSLARLDAGDARGAEEFAREGLWHARRSGNDARIVRALQMLSRALQQQNRFEDCDAALDEAARLAAAMGHRLLVVETQRQHLLVLMASGDWMRVRRELPEAIRRSYLIDSPSQLSAVLMLRATLDMFACRHSAARRGARQLARLARRGGNADLWPDAYRPYAGALTRRGRPERAAAALERHLAKLPLRFDPRRLAWIQLEHALAIVSQERWSDVPGLLRGMADREFLEHADAVAAVYVGRALLRNGGPEPARGLLERCEAYQARHPRPFVEAHVDQLRAELAIVEGVGDRARIAADAALARFESFPATYERACAALEFGALALAHGRSGELPVESWLSTALEAFERIGNRRMRLRALELQSRWLRSRGPGAPLADDRQLFESVGALLRSLSDLPMLAQRALELAGRQFDAERGALLLLDPEAGGLRVLAEFGALDSRSRDIARRFSRRAVDHVMRTGTGLVLTDALADSSFASESVTNLQLRSIVCVPLVTDGRAIGAVYLDDSRRAGTFADAERGLLEGFGHLIAQALGSGLVRQDAELSHQALLSENADLRRVAGDPVRTGHVLLGVSPSVRRVQALIERAAETQVTVLITGETGSGKDLVALSLHYLGRRSSGPFVALNCAALTGTLLEAELFGIEPGVATGVTGRPGAFERANHGTLFLDEIGDMPPEQQVALLRVLANREVTRVGGSRAIPVDVRVVAATNQDLRVRIRDHRFREDLYFRLAVFLIEVPPLRMHKSDIPMLATHFVTHFSAQMGRPAPTMSREFLATLVQSDWPGNVRELINYVERMVAMTPGDVLRPDPPPRDIEEQRDVPRLPREQALASALEDLERRMILRALDDARGNQSQAARLLGIREQTLRYRMRRYFPVGTRRNRRIRGIR